MEKGHFLKRIQVYRASHKRRSKQADSKSSRAYGWPSGLYTCMRGDRELVYQYLRKRKITCKEYHTIPIILSGFY